MKRLLPVFALGAACSSLCSCAGPSPGVQKEKFAVFSEPRGAHVQLSNGATGTTPTHFVIQRDGDLTVTIGKEGYETVMIPVRSSKKINRAEVALKLPLAVIICPLVLPEGFELLASGEARLATHRPNPVKVKLKPLAPIEHDGRVWNIN